MRAVAYRPPTLIETIRMDLSQAENALRTGDGILLGRCVAAAESMFAGLRMHATNEGAVWPEEAPTEPTIAPLPERSAELALEAPLAGPVKLASFVSGPWSPRSCDRGRAPRGCRPQITSVPSWRLLAHLGGRALRAIWRAVRPNKSGKI